MLIKSLVEISEGDLNLVGGKAASLAKLTKEGFCVPEGFVITTEAFKKFHKSELSPEFVNQVMFAFEKLKSTRVSVRSSSLEEDSKSASWAGQFVSFLNVSKGELLKRIKDCWDSIDLERVSSYANLQNNTEPILLGVIVQKMINSKVSGVMFTQNPVTQKDEIMIESIFGLGELIVQGEVSPDNFIISKKMEILARNIEFKDKQLIFRDGDNREVGVFEDLKNSPSLTDQQIKELAALGKKIEDRYGAPQDIEWAIADNRIYILQSRPITTLGGEELN